MVGVFGVVWVVEEGDRYRVVEKDHRTIGVSMFKVAIALVLWIFHVNVGVVFVSGIG